MEKINTIAIYGKSGHGKVIEDVASLLGYREVIWVDDNNSEAISAKEYFASYLHVKIIVAIGDNKTRAKITQTLEKKGASFVTLIHPRAVVSSSAVLGEGSVVMANAVINAATVIGKSAIINSSCVIEHDNILADFVHVSPNASLAGNVQVDTFSHIGIGASVIQGIHIGSSSIIGAGSVVIHNVDDDVIAVGVPAFYKKSVHA